MDKVLQLEAFIEDKLYFVSVWSFPSRPLNAWKEIK